MDGVVVHIIVYVIVIIAVVDDYRLSRSRAAELLNLPAAVGAYHGVCGYHLTAVLAEFSRAIERLLIILLGHIVLMVCLRISLLRLGIALRL